MTYRCIIIDDEEMSIERLERFFHKNETQFKLVGKAYSGAEGIELAIQTKPDIVLTDIVMPGINGIEMIRQLRPLLPRTEYVILSAYSDFHYAKQAMSLNVVEYAVKVPFSDEEVLAALHRTEERLDIHNSQKLKLQKLEHHRLEHVFRIRRQQIGELIRGNIATHQFAGLAESMNVEAKLLNSYCCVVMEWVDISRFLNRYTAHDQHTIRYGMINIAEETIRGQASGFACEWSDERLLAIVSWPNMNSAAYLLNNSIALGHELISNMRKFMKESIHVAISDCYHGWESLPLSFKEATSLCEYGYYVSSSEVFTSKTVSPTVPSAEAFMVSELERLFTNLQKEPPISEMLEIANSIKEVAIRYCLPRVRMTTLIGEFIAKVRYKATASQKDTVQWPNPNNFGAMFDEQWQIVLEVIRLYLYKPVVSGNKEIVKAKHFIETHLAEKVTLNDVANDVGLAPTYFCALFKKETGESFVDYVNRCKIEKAAALLQSSEYSNNEICMLVGIQTEKYLCKLFKDMYGISPQKFRKSIR